jgi:hypothetical protein
MNVLLGMQLRPARTDGAERRGAACCALYGHGKPHPYRGVGWAVPDAIDGHEPFLPLFKSAAKASFHFFAFPHLFLSDFPPGYEL